MKFEVQGRTAYAYTGGKPWADAERCVVFIHGALNDHSVWTLLARWFANHGHAVIAVDLPGHGRSAGAPIHACAEDMDKDGALCYPKCKAGFHGVGPVCWENKG